MAKWIDFIDLTDKSLGLKTKLFAVENKETKVRIGKIQWYGPFRQYSFFPHQNMVFEKTCLRDIADFLDKLMEEWRANRPPKPN